MSWSSGLVFAVGFCSNCWRNLWLWCVWHCLQVGGSVLLLLPSGLHGGTLWRFFLFALGDGLLVATRDTAACGLSPSRRISHMTALLSPWWWTPSCFFLSPRAAGQHLAAPLDSTRVQVVWCWSLICRLVCSWLASAVPSFHPSFGRMLWVATTPGLWA